jgi:acyl-CoA synthetase (AMP-forming)/AMP-acid ligase II
MVIALAHRAQGLGDPDKRHGVVLALTINNMQIVGPLLGWASGCAVVLVDKPDTATIVDFVKRERIGTMAIVPTMLYDLLNNPAVRAEDVAPLVKPKLGGAAAPEPLRVQYRERYGIEPVSSYGLTEAPTVVSLTSQSARIPLSSGKPLAHLAIRICDDAGREVAAGETGEVCVGAAATGEWANVYTPMLGYWNRPDATAEALRDGWLRTGDLGYVDTGGNLFIKDRKKEMIIRGGSNVYPAEVERVIQQDPRVQACAVVGRPDARLGERVVAFVQPVASAAWVPLEQDLRGACERELARYKQPQEWIAVQEFPRNTMGKVVKPELRKRYFA